MKITLVGQATVLIEMEGLVIMTDPWWGQFEFLRGVPIGLDPETLNRVDIMAVTHNHVDHFCRPAIELARRLESTVVGSVKAARRAMKHGLDDVHQLIAGESVRVRGITIHAVPADHPFARDAVGLVIEGERTVYFSGDTRYVTKLKEALSEFTIDIAMVQVACSHYPFIGKDGMDMEDAARLVRDLKPGIVVPVHFQVKGKTIGIEALQEWEVDAGLIVPKPGIPMEVT